MPDPYQTGSLKVKRFRRYPPPYIAEILSRRQVDGIGFPLGVGGIAIVAKIKL